MKQALWVLIIIVAAISGLHARRLNQASIITGRVSPATAVNQILAIRGTDSVRTILKDGAFILQLKTGRYKIIINAIRPYKDVVKEGIFAEPGKNTDLGEINLEQ
jgi:hypothetical protein